MRPEVKRPLVATKFVVKLLVLVAFVVVELILVSPVKVARVPKRFVMVPWVAARTEEKKLVVVALVPVALVQVSRFIWLAPENVLLSVSNVEEAAVKDFVVIQ